MCAGSAIRPFRPHGSRLRAGYRRKRPRHRFPPKPAARSSRSRTPPNQAVRRGYPARCRGGRPHGKPRPAPQIHAPMRDRQQSIPSAARTGQASRQERGCRFHPAPAPAPPRQRETGLAPPPRQPAYQAGLLCPSGRVQTPPQTALLGRRKNHRPNRPPNRPRRTPNPTFFYKITTPVAGPIARFPHRFPRTRRKI